MHKCNKSKHKMKRYGRSQTDMGQPSSLSQLSMYMMARQQAVTHFPTAVRTLPLYMLNSAVVSTGTPR